MDNLVVERAKCIKGIGKYRRGKWYSWKEHPYSPGVFVFRNDYVYDRYFSYANFLEHFQISEERRKQFKNVPTDPPEYTTVEIIDFYETDRIRFAKGDELHLSFHNPEEVEVRGYHFKAEDLPEDYKMPVFLKYKDKYQVYMLNMTEEIELEFDGEKFIKTSEKITPEAKVQWKTDPDDEYEAINPIIPEDGNEIVIVHEKDEDGSFWADVRTEKGGFIGKVKVSKHGVPLEYMWHNLPVTLEVDV